MDTQALDRLYRAALGWLAKKPAEAQEDYVAMLAGTFTKTRAEIAQDFKQATGLALKITLALALMFSTACVHRDRNVARTSCFTYGNFTHCKTKLPKHYVEPEEELAQADE